MMLTLREKRQAAQLTQRQLAKLVRMSHASICAYEQGQREPANITLARIDKVITEELRKSKFSLPKCDPVTGYWPRLHRVYAVLHQRKWTMVELAFRTGYDTNYTIGICSGNVKPSKRVLQCIAQALKLDVEKLYTMD